MAYRNGIRLCTVYKWAGSKSFGFTLNTIYKDDTSIHYIAGIKPGTSAAYSGLIDGDRVIEVNGLNVSGMDHAAAAYRVASKPEVATLLVSDPETCGFYESHYRIIDTDIPSITRIQGPQADITEVLSGHIHKHGFALTAPFHDIRLCLIHKWPGKKNFGYVLEYSDDWEEVRVTDVVTDSSAARAGLRVGDRIAEVDGIAVSKENSALVTSKITSCTFTQISLLVASEKTFWYFRSRHMLILPYSRIVVRIDGPAVSLDYDTGYSKSIAETSETFIDDLTSCVLNAETIKASSKPQPKTSVIVAGRHDQYIAKRCSGIRLCVIRKWPDFPEFGFSLLTRKAKNKRYILEVLPQSPAAYSGLRKNDRVLEVNGIPVDNESHEQLIERIKSSGDTVSLLVIDEETDAYYRLHHKDLRSPQSLNMPIATRIEGPSRRPGGNTARDQQPNVSGIQRELALAKQDQGLVLKEVQEAKRVHPNRDATLTPHHDLGSWYVVDIDIESGAQDWHSTPKKPVQETIARETHEPERLRTAAVESMEREDNECTVSIIEPVNSEENCSSLSFDARLQQTLSSDSSLKDWRSLQLNPVEIRSPNAALNKKIDVTAGITCSEDTRVKPEVNEEDSALHLAHQYSHQNASSGISSAVAGNGTRLCEKLLAADRARIAQLKLKFIAGIADDEAGLALSPAADDQRASSPDAASSADGTGKVHLPSSAEGRPGALGEGTISRLRRELLQHFGYNSSEISAKLVHCQLIGSTVNFSEP